MSLGLGNVGFEPMGQLYHVGAPFKALLVDVLRFRLQFYQILSLALNNVLTGSCHPSESLRSKMTSNDWTKAQIFTKLVRSYGHLKSATFWLYDCPCEMELSTSFQSKMSKFQCLSHFFQKNQATDLLLFVLVRKGRKVGTRIKQQWDSWKCQESWFGLCFCNLKPFAAFWRIPDQCL